ncbi:MAG: hemagglutinin, partial [Spirochaetales bacterium]|nr:hemagglutinin [Spirochaetales bacterium]
AFKIEEVGKTPLTNAYNVSFVTGVNNLLYGSINTKDDPYFSLNLSDSGYSWGLLSELYITYDSSTGHITDLAGNLLASVSSPIRCIERVPPKINFSLSVVDQNTVYAKFSEPVYGNKISPRIPITKDDFAFQPSADNSISSMQLLDKSASNGVQEVLFTLTKPLTTDDAVEGIIAPKANSIYDKAGNEMPSTSVHRITDIGLGVVEPVWASDGIHSDALHGGTSGALRTFDGTGRLMDRDITLEVSILTSAEQDTAAKLYYDVAPDSSYLADGIWLPSLIQGFTPKVNTEARGLVPFRKTGAVRDFLIPGSDEEIKTGVDLEFIVQLGNLYCARAVPQTDTSSKIPWLIQPWVIPIRDIVRQKAGVTILNNVINPTRGEKTVINYTTARSGLVTVQVFNLEGDIVQILHRGRQVKGEYLFAWDGRNRGGRIVARGVYFIRVVGPGIDEIRKVLIVK